MVLGLVLDNHGVPVCCELWPGNTADVTTLVPVAQRLQDRFGIRSVCLVADRGMLSQATVAAVEEQGWSYILGVRMRSSKEFREEVLGADAPEVTVSVERAHQPRRPLELKIQGVRVRAADAGVSSERRLEAAGIEVEWADLMRDLGRLRETEVQLQGKRFVVRSKAYGAVGQVAQCVGARLPATVRRVSGERAEAAQAPTQRA